MRTGNVRQQAEDHVITLALEPTGAGRGRLHAVCGLRDLAGHPGSKAAVREAGGVEVLLGLLDDTSEPAVTAAAVQALTCLAVDDSAAWVCTHDATPLIHSHLQAKLKSLVSDVIGCMSLHCRTF